MSSGKGIFTVSLDFELHYGVSDSRTVESYGENLRNTPLAVERMLGLFERYGVHASWATVGMLFCENKQEVLEAAPEVRPTYRKEKLSNYRILDSIGADLTADPYHYAWPLIERIAATPGQEVGTHTFSHLYCLEAGSTLAAFESDLRAAIAIGKRKGIAIRSIVFPRNQYSTAHLEVCKRLGIVVYRGTESHWLYATKSREEETSLRRAGRLLDAYLPITANLCTCVPAQAHLPVDVPASRFLRPVSKIAGLLEPLRVRRILNELTRAARQGKLYHLWWHPHNFGQDMDDNLAVLERVLRTFAELRTTHGMRSLNMVEVAEQLAHEN